MTDITVRFAATEQDAVAIHRFLCVVAGPSLPGEIDPLDSIQEVLRVVNEDCALMAMRDDRLVGTMGIIRPGHWWNKKAHFLANRWFFALPGTGAGKLLRDEAEEIAKASDLELHIYNETKGRLIILNRHPKRSAENPVLAKAVGMPVDPAPENSAPTQH